jgi:endonuclease/exonuclease/phosphatase family metal-dependent hydrolase
MSHADTRLPLRLLALALALAACSAEPSPLDGPSLPRDLAVQDRGAAAEQRLDAASPRALTVVTLNTHSFQEGVSSLEKLDAIGKGLATIGADLVALNEVMSGSFASLGGAQHDAAALIRASLEQASGASWHLTSIGFAHWSTGEMMANAILSRTPLSETGSRALTTTDFWPAPGEQRNVVHARTAVPGIGIVNLFVTHAWGWSSKDTLAQIGEVKGYLAEKARGDEAISLLCGDLNMPSSQSGYQSWIDPPPAKLLDTYLAANPQGTTDSTTFDEPHRIDYILATGTPTVLRSRRVFDGSAENGVVLPRVSDHKGVLSVLRVF